MIYHGRLLKYGRLLVFWSKLTGARLFGYGRLLVFNVFSTMLVY